MFVDPPFKWKKEEAERMKEQTPAPAPAELPLDKEEIDARRNHRNAYMEAREAVELEQKELKAVHEQIGKEIREMCRPEIDEYVDCCVGRVFTLLQCKPYAFRLRRCIAKVETPEFVSRRTKELLAEREANGESILNNATKGTTRERRAMYNRAILSNVEDTEDMLIKKPEPQLRKAPGQ
mmetsp:Transcript_33176/g.50126  ORF Transcript_33176/g.50126 Transcript_33176/m.50126 type:complete len:180 (+) Transcript_33176:60-599(+)|eukprot:CAMPEP_0206473118 /NCGR_PEP_ID=MMETSP0324_2-20121206/32649_1 /ASSEMBLY_ACC=CAM_ASM_000836 /TAXON_ID=2866 /ORGANISM="Crypthecodinium cohnii, Strain Seligo" /LENGTH=179 /DNA_ID=CAMNT_0053947935 /DNA_START=73 /DNA_END=612 /DNA_ORIENTATION=-